MTYDRLANVYDQFMSAAPYDQWTDVTEEIFKHFSHSTHTVIDLGCGTGEITARLAEKGYEMIGVDHSENMLTCAQHKANEKQLDIQWIHQDIRQLEGLNHLDAAISYCDVINYITSEREVKAVFGKANRALKEGGIFIFDVHSLYHVKNHLLERTFADVTDKQAYIWFCYQGDYEGEMFHDLTFFEQIGNSYRRYDEYHHQRTFPIAVYKQLLVESGFEVNHMFGDFSFNERLHDQAKRIFFVAEKKME
ncbi:MAG TPA: class I SAM-dependent methyltransferase [Bacillota bacterium]|nr:class I SAM-dependent methyltransferase [Bacillota bacterium]